MNCNAFIEELDALVDGELSPAHAEALHEHAAGCVECAGALAATRRLKEMALALPASRQPSRDLWPGIEQRIAPRRAHATPWFRAVAAGLLVAAVFFSGMLADRVLRDDERPVPRQLAQDTTETARELPSVDDARRLLPATYVALVEGRNTQNSTGTEQALLQNLLLVNLAIRQVEDAAAADPSNPDLRELLAGLYVQENRILSQAERLQVTRQATLRTGI